MAAAAEARPTERWPILRLENLDTDLPLPPEAIPVTTEALATPKANSWLPFTGDEDLRHAISDFLEARTGHRYDPIARDRRHERRDRGRARRADRHRRSRRRGRAHRSDLRRSRQSRADRRRRAAIRALPRRGRRVAVRPGRARRSGHRPDEGAAADEPLDAVGRDPHRRTTGKPCATSAASAT